jgi:hypothetical protein
MGIFKLGIFKGGSQGQKAQSSTDVANAKAGANGNSTAEKSFKGPKRATKPSTRNDASSLQTIPYASLTQPTRQPPAVNASASRSASQGALALGSSTSSTGRGEQYVDRQGIDSSWSRHAGRSPLQPETSDVHSGHPHHPANGHKALPTPPIHSEALSRPDVRQRRSLFSLRSFSGGKEAETTGPESRSDSKPNEAPQRRPSPLAVAVQPDQKHGLRPARDPNSPSHMTLPVPSGSPRSETDGKGIPHPAQLSRDHSQGTSVTERIASQNDYFEVRNFRHVSGTGESPWQRSPASIRQLGPSSPSVRSPGSVAASNHEEVMTEAARPTAPRLSRPPSFAGSIGGEEPARQVSAQFFKQARRQSTSSVFTLEAYQQPDDDDRTAPSSDAHAAQAERMTRLKRTSTRESSIEMLTSPKRKPLGIAGNDRPEVIIQPSHDAMLFQKRQDSQDGRFDHARTTSNENIAQHVLEPAAQILMPKKLVPTDRAVNRTADVALAQRRAFSFAGTALREYSPASSDRGEKRDVRLPETFVRTHDRSRSTSSMPTGGFEAESQNRTKNRLPLNERLASAALVTASTANTQDCLIPPVKSHVEASMGSAETSMARTGFPSSSSLPRLDAKSTSSVNSPLSSPARRSRVRHGWDSSSSDSSGDEQQPRRKMASKAKPAQKASIPVRSLPSGVRKPPHPSEAFGEASSGRPLTHGSRTPSTHSVRSLLSQSSGKVLPSATSRNFHHEDESDASSSSSSDESLAVIMRKQSKTSLKAQFAASTPNLTSPTKQSHSPGAARNSPIKSAMKMASPPAGSSGKPVSQRALPVPPLAPALPTYPILSGYGQNSFWPRESPASSQSGTTGEASSRNGPLTPQEVGMISQPVVVGGASSADGKNTSPGPNSRRVSFLNAGWQQSSTANALETKNQTVPALVKAPDGNSVSASYTKSCPIAVLIEYGQAALQHPAGVLAGQFNGGLDAAAANQSSQYQTDSEMLAAQQNMQLQMQMQMQMQLHMQMQWQQYNAAQMVPGYMTMHQQA